MTTTYSKLRAANIARQAEWCPDQVPDLSFRGNELAGEVGEACNVIKKIERERRGWEGSRASFDDLAAELADVVICADLVALSAGIDLDAAVEIKFNSTSEKHGFATRLVAGISSERIDDVLEANNRYQQDARNARARLKELESFVAVLRTAIATQALIDDQDARDVSGGYVHVGYQWRHFEPVSGAVIWRDEQYWNGRRSDTARDVFAKADTLGGDHIPDAGKMVEQADSTTIDMPEHLRRWIDGGVNTDHALARRADDVVAGEREAGHADAQS